MISNIDRTTGNRPSGETSDRRAVRPTSQVYTTSTKGVPVMPNRVYLHSPDRPAVAFPHQLSHCRSFDSTYAQLIGTSPSSTYSGDRSAHSESIPLRQSTSGSHLYTPTHRSRAELASGLLSIDSHARQRSDKYLKTVRKSARQKSRQERIARLDDAIYELEQMYRQLRLNDDELLDRAERRDLPSQHQLLRFQSNDGSNRANQSIRTSTSSNESLVDCTSQYNVLAKQPPSIVSTANANASHVLHTATNQSNAVPYGVSSNGPTIAKIHHNRTPPMRRSAVPDLISDDLAVRRLQPSPLQNSRSTGDLLDRHPSRSYMSQCLAYDERSLPTTPLPMRRLPGQPIEPDPELDDFTYRRLTQSDAANVPPPHPPFGIPLQPVQHNPVHDYMHFRPQPNASANRSGNTITRTIARKSLTADPLQDDLALRAWRKDLREPLAAQSGSSAAITSILRQTEVSNQTPSKSSPVNATNPYSNKLRATTANFFQQPEQLGPVTTKNVADTYLLKCKQSLRPTRSFAADDLNSIEVRPSVDDAKRDTRLKPSHSFDSAQTACRNVSGGHVGGKLFTRIQQNLQALDKENQTQNCPQSANTIGVPKNRIYNRTAAYGSTSKTPSPQNVSQPTSSNASPTNLQAMTGCSPPKGLIFRKPTNPDSSNKRLSASNLTSRSKADEEQLEQMLQNLSNAPAQINHKPIQSSVWQKKANFVTDRERDAVSERERPSSTDLPRSQSACAWADGEINLRPQIPFFVRHPEPDYRHQRDATAPLSAPSIVRSGHSPTQSRSSVWSTAAGLSSLDVHDSPPTSEYLKFIPPTPLKSQVNEIKQLFECKAPGEANRSRRQNDLFQRTNSLDSANIGTCAGSAAAHSTLPDKKSSIAAMSTQSLRLNDSVGSSVSSLQIAQFDSNRNPPELQNQLDRETISKQQTSDNQSKCNDVWSDGRKTEPSSASPVRKRLNRSQTEGAVPVRASAGPRRRNAAMRYESRRESDEQDESEHETSSSSSDSGASVQSGQSVFVPKGAHAKAQLPNKLTVSSSRRPKLSAKLKRRFAK